MTIHTGSSSIIPTSLTMCGWSSFFMITAWKQWFWSFYSGMYWFYRCKMNHLTSFTHELLLYISWAVLACLYSHVHSLSCLEEDTRFMRGLSWKLNLNRFLVISTKSLWSVSLNIWACRCVTDALTLLL